MSSTLKYQYRCPDCFNKATFDVKIGSLDMRRCAHCMTLIQSKDFTTRVEERQPLTTSELMLRDIDDKARRG